MVWSRAPEQRQRLDETVEQPSKDGSEHVSGRAAARFGGGCWSPAPPRRRLPVDDEEVGRFLRIRAFALDDADSHAALAFVAYPRLTFNYDATRIR